MSKNAENHWFKLELKNIDRNTNRSAWKEISRWLRIARRKIEVVACTQAPDQLQYEARIDL